MNRALQQTFFFFCACFIISQTLCAGFITYNDFGSPRDRNNFTSRIGITSIELKSDTVPGSPLGLAVANGALFVSTETGAILSFGQESDYPSAWILY